MVYAAVAVAESFMPDLKAFAFNVVLEVMTTGALYTDDEAVGSLPSVV